MSNDSTGIGFAKVIQGMGEAAADTNREIAAQRTQLQAEIGQINLLGTAAEKNSAGSAMTPRLLRSE